MDSCSLQLTEGGYLIALLYLFRKLWFAQKRDLDADANIDENHVLLPEKTNYGSASLITINQFRIIGDTLRLLFYQFMFISLLLRVITIPLLYDTDKGFMKSTSFVWLSSIALTEFMYLSAYVVLTTILLQLTASNLVHSLQKASHTISLRKRMIVSLSLLSLYGILIFTIHATFISQYQSILCTVLCSLYATLFCSMAFYIGPLLILKVIPNEDTHKALSLRLIGSCLVCSFLFIFKAIIFATLISDISIAHKLWVVSAEQLPNWSIFLIMHNYSIE